MFDSKANTLLAVVQTGSYTKAAAKLNLTQPAVSHHIRLLETEFNIKLFYRDKNKLKLTPQGKISRTICQAGCRCVRECLPGAGGQQDGGRALKRGHHPYGRRDYSAPGFGHALQ